MMLMDSFYKATWNDAWQHSGFLSLARIAAKQQRLDLGLAACREITDQELS